MVGDLIGGAEAVVQAGKLVSTVSQLNSWETVAVIGTLGAFGTSWLRSEITTIVANDLVKLEKNLLESARNDKEELRNEINGCNNKTFDLALSVIKSPDKSAVTTEYLKKKFVPLSEFQEMGEGPQIETQERKGED